MKHMKRKQVIKQYGSQKQTIPLLMPDTRYEAFKRILGAQGKDVNKTVRDLIEAAYGRELDRKERSIIVEERMRESA